MAFFIFGGVSMSLINVQNLSFSYEGNPDLIFDNVSLKLDTKWKLGFIGRNGRGKTTFLKLLKREYTYQGNISSSVNFDYFPFEVLDKSLNIIGIFQNISSEIVKWQIQRELSLLSVSSEILYMPFNNLSSGEQTKILLAALFLKPNNFLLIDEPTNHLDLEARKVVTEYLQGKSGFILVSHDRHILDNCVDHILSINKTNIELQKGNFSSWWHNKNLRDQYEKEENEKLQDTISKLTESSKRTLNWSDKVEKTKFGNGPVDRGYIGHKAAKMMKRSKTIEQRREKAIEEKQKLLKNIEKSEALAIKPQSHHKNLLAEASSLSISYGHRVIFRDLNFFIYQGQRVALQGKNGSGKSSILKVLLGENIQYDGTFKIASNLKISYVPQDTSFLKGDLKDFAYERGIDETLFKTILRKFGFSREQFKKEISIFSEGQKKKILIAGSLCEKAHLYVWDEPLNFIDVISRIQIEELLLKYKPTMIFVEHDISFVENVATDFIKLMD